MSVWSVDAFQEAARPMHVTGARFAQNQVCKRCPTTVQRRVRAQKNKSVSIIADIPTQARISAMLVRSLQLRTKNIHASHQRSPTFHVEWRLRAAGRDETRLTLFPRICRRYLSWLTRCHHLLQAALPRLSLLRRRRWPGARVRAVANGQCACEDRSCARTHLKIGRVAWSCG